MADAAAKIADIFSMALGLLSYSVAECLPQDPSPPISPASLRYLPLTISLARPQRRVVCRGNACFAAAEFRNVGYT